MRTPVTTLRPNALAQRITGRNYLSFSAVSLYQRCPLAYRFKYVDGLPEETVSASLAFGGAIHASLERYFKTLMTGGEAPDHATLLDVFWDAWRERAETATIAFGKHEDAHTIGQLADRVLAAFRESELAQPAGAILGVEEELRGQLLEGTPDLLARIDLLTETEDALTVTDFKTAPAAGAMVKPKSRPSSCCCTASWSERWSPTKGCGWSSRC